MFEVINSPGLLKAVPLLISTLFVKHFGVLPWLKDEILFDLWDTVIFGYMTYAKLSLMLFINPPLIINDSWLWLDNNAPEKENSLFQP